MTKINEKIAKYAREHNEENAPPFFSFEYFPPKTEAGITKLYTVFDSMGKHNPMWIDVTWGAGGQTADSTLKICEIAASKGLDVMMHLTCTNMDINLLTDALQKCRELGIKNILALRGDPPAGQEWKAIEGGFSNAIDLVKYIRAEYGDYFAIGVGGYPEGHTDCDGNIEQDMQYLKEKVDAGSDMIVTQLFYDTQCFVDFCHKCKNMGINVPIFPGIMPIQTYGGFMRMTSLCQTKVPQHIFDALEPIKEDPERVKEFGVELAAQMCSDIMEKCGRAQLGDCRVQGLHFYSLNMPEATESILRKLRLIPEVEPVPISVFPAMEAAAVYC